MFPAVPVRQWSSLPGGAGSQSGPRPGLSMWVSLGVNFGIASFTILAAAMFGLAGVVMALAAALAGGASAWSTGSPDRRLRGHLAIVISLAAAVVVMSVLFAIPADPTTLTGYWVGAAMASQLGTARGVGWPIRLSTAGVVGVTATLLVWAAPNVAGAWSVDEPSSPTAVPQQGNGVTEAVDTHAFLLRQGVRILRADGHTALAQFVTSPDPTAPRRVDADGRLLPGRESYLWRLQTGSREADRSLKPVAMPDHFFNWWTHSGKGLIVGPSAATWAEQQFDQAVEQWRAGRESAAMYHLGAAAHLVGDACTPPHATVLLPNHRQYEEWVLSQQQTWAVRAGGIYASDFRQGSGHGGPEWSSDHTRGWVDECAHRAAALTVTAAQPVPDDPASSGYANTRRHFADVQRLTAGYLLFFFDTVGLESPS